MDDNVGQHDFAVIISNSGTSRDSVALTDSGPGLWPGVPSGSSITVQVHGDFDRNACAHFEQAVGTLDRSGDVIVDIGSSSTIDSSAIGSLVRLCAEVHAADGDFSVVVARPFQRRILEITDLTVHLHVVDRTAEDQPST